MTVSSPLSATLQVLRAAAFHGDPRPVTAITVDGDEARWLLGVCHGAVGRYAAALTTLDTVRGDGQVASLALSTSASLRRQLGRHAEALPRDRAALELARGDADVVDAALGIAADHVGLGDLTAARAALELVPTPGEWRGRVRRMWVAAEIALLGDAADEAADQAAAAVRCSRESRAPRHVAKSLLIQGVALAADGRVEEGGLALRRSIALARGLGCWPLVWPAAQVLSELVDPPESAGLRALSGAVIAAIAGGLPAGWAAEWPATQPSIGTSGSTGALTS